MSPTRFSPLRKDTSKRLPSKPRILILYTGGTFGMDMESQLKAMESKKKTSVLIRIPELSPALLKQRVLASVPEISQIAQCKIKVLLNLDSAHVGPSQWLLMVRAIRQAWKTFDGIVILHGTDTLAYTASALSLLLRPCLKPIVLTGAQRPLSAIRSDARTNLVSAVEIAATGPRDIVSRVCVFFGNRLFQGHTLRKKSASDYYAFDSTHAPPVAKVGVSIRYEKKNFLDQFPVRPYLKPIFNETILHLRVTPGFPSQFVRSILSSGTLGTAGISGIVLSIFPSGTAPTHDPEFLAFLDAARQNDIPIIALTGEGSEISHNDPSYSSGKTLLYYGCLLSGLVTPEYAYVLTSLLLGQTRNMQTFKNYWKKLTRL